MSNLAEDFILAMREACRIAGSQSNLSKKTGIHQSRISDYVNGRYDFDNITIGTLRKFFPQVKIVYFDENISPPNSDAETIIVNRMIGMINKMTLEDKVRCFEMMSRTFGESF